MRRFLSIFVISWMTKLYIKSFFFFLHLFFLIWSIKELVKVEKNGLLFSSSSELADELMVRPDNDQLYTKLFIKINDWCFYICKSDYCWFKICFWCIMSFVKNSMQMLFKGYPDECDALKLLRKGVHETRSSVSWETEWEAKAKPLVNEARSTFLLKPSLWFTIQDWS